MAEAATRTVERALALLGAVCDAGTLSLTDAARTTDLHASTALRLLRTLEASGFVRRDDGADFRPGMRIVQLGAQALSHESLVSLAAEPMRRIVAECGESTYLSVPAVTGAAARNCIYIAMEEGTHSVRHASWVGRSFPADESAAGAVLRGESTDLGYLVVDRGVEHDVTAIAAPITVGSHVVAALSVVIPTYRVTDELIARIGARVADEANHLLPQESA